jgi:glycosyltransferase 2 family protein
VKKSVRILGSLALLGALAWLVNWHDLGKTLRLVDVRLCMLAMGVMVAAQVVSSLRWQMLARVLHFGGSLGCYVAYYFIGMLFNLVLPTTVGGDVVRAWYLSAQEGSPSAPAGWGGRRLDALLAVFAERLSGVTVLLLLACISTLLCPVELPGYIPVGVAAIGAGGLVGLVLTAWLARRSADAPSGAVGGVVGRIGKMATVQRLLAVVRCYWARPDVVLTSLALSVVVQMASVHTTWLVMRSLGLSVPWLYLGVVIPLATLVTMLPISINGMGLKAGSLLLLLAPLGITGTQVAMISMLQYGLTVVVSLSAGLSCYLFGRFPRFEMVSGPERGGEGSAAAPAQVVGEVARDEDPVRGDPDQGRKGQPPAAA